MSESEAQNPKPEPKLPVGKRLERGVGNVLLALILIPLRKMPWGMARGAGKTLGALLFLALGRYRSVALKNLRLVYGKERSERQIRGMARAVFLHFGEMATEFVKLPTLSRERVDSMIVVEGEEHLREGMESGKGVLLITGHFGNWEMMARWLTTHGYPLNVVARGARAPSASKLLEETRRGGGANVLYRGNSARGILQHLKKGEIVAILPDQNAADAFAPFFGFPTGTADGAAVIHLRTQAPLLFAWCIRTPEDRFRLQFEPLESVPPTGEKAEDILKTLTLINARLEARIREHPTQWLWLHDRWKASPGVFPDGAENARLLKMTPKEREEEERKR